MALLLVIPPLAPLPPGAEYGWASWTGDAHKPSAHGSAAPALLPGSGDVTLGIPAAALSWQAVHLPQGNAGGAVRLRAVLAGLLEDRLLDDPESLHFALEPDARSGATAWVAVCQRSWLREVVQALEAAGRRVARIVPEYTPRPADAPPALFATGEPESPWLTVCDGSGVITLPLNAGGVALAGAPGDGATLRAEPAVAELAESLWGRPVPILTTAERWLLALQSSWDLAQFDFASSGRARAGKQLTAITQALWAAPQWRAARWGVGLLLAAQFVGVNAWAWKERSALDSKRAQVRSVLTQTFPSVKLVVDAPVQMAREVAALQQSTGGVNPADLEPMLGALATSLPPGRTPTAIDYNAGQLRLRGLGLSPSELSGLGNILVGRGYSARSEGDLLLVQAEAAR